MQAIPYAAPYNSSNLDIPIIDVDDGWKNEIKPKAIDPLEVIDLISLLFLQLVALLFWYRTY